MSSPRPEQVLRYVCALFSELAYQHIPQNEIDDQRRVKFIPCYAYQRLAAEGVSIDVTTIIRNINVDLPPPFVIATRGVIIVGTLVRRELFIAFRGTQDLFADWSINLRLCLVAAIACFPRHLPHGFYSAPGRVHAGFGTEAGRVCRDISQEIQELIRTRYCGRRIDEIFVTGHSLGGAVAAIVGQFMQPKPTTVCILGTPRYCDAEAFSDFRSSPPTHIRRPADIVPALVPGLLGYADHCLEFEPNGRKYAHSDLLTLQSAQRLWSFLARHCKDHFMEQYRHELGLSIKAKGALLPLVSS
jgi:hypothetical protein